MRHSVSRRRNAERPKAIRKQDSTRSFAAKQQSIHRKQQRQAKRITTTAL